MLTTLAHRGIRLIDLLVRKAAGVHEFSDADGCILRIALERAKEGVTLSDGTRVEPGDLLCGMHLWNERLPRMASAGPDLAWALDIYRGMVRSLSLLAAHVETNPMLRDAVAVHGVAMAMQDLAAQRMRQIFSRLGFDVVPSRRRTRWGRFALWWQNLYANWLVWAYNAPAGGGKRLGGSLDCELWLSRRALETRYGAGGGGKSGRNAAASKDTERPNGRSA